MQFNIKIDLDSDGSVTPEMVCDALDFIDNWPLRFTAGMSNPIIDVNGVTLGKWEVTDTPADPIERMYAEAFAESTPTHGMVCSEDEIAEDIALLTPEDRAEWNKLPTPPDTAREAFELIVRWGRPDEEDEPREAKVYTFETEAERNAYRDGIIEAQPDTTRFDFYTRNADGTIPEDEEWEALHGESEE